MWGAEILCRLLLRIHPRDFRDAYAREVTRALRDDLRDAGSASGRGNAWRALVSGLGDVALAGLAARGRQVAEAFSEPALFSRTRNRRSHTMDNLTQDFRFALRSLLQNPGPSALIVLILALAIGANAALFSVVDNVLLRPLPFSQAEELVMVWGADRETGRGAWWTSYPDFVDFEAAAESFRRMAAFYTPRVDLVGAEGDPEKVPAARVSHGYFEVMGVEPAAGRVFGPEEDRVGGEPVVLLSHGLWQRRYGGDVAILGRPITVNGSPHTVVGILPAEFRYPSGSEVWLPVAPAVGESSRGAHRLRVVARLEPPTTPQQATAEMRAIARRLEDAHPASNARRSAWVQPLLEARVGDVRPALWMLLGAVGLVLLIACANVANLLLCGAVGRTSEMALRSSLGATRWRLARQLWTESLLLALAGGLAGCALGRAFLRLLITASPVSVPRLDEVALDARVVAVMLGVTVVTGLLFGAVPAFRLSRGDLRTALRTASRGATLGGSRHGLQKTLVASEVALAVVLVIAAGLLVRSFSKLTAVEPGFDPERVLTLRLSLPPDPYEDWPQVTAFYRQLTERVAGLPGVGSATAAAAHPLEPSWTTSFTIEGMPEPPVGEKPEAFIRPIAPCYFETMGIPLVRGRTFTEHDTSESPGVVIINEAFARSFFAGRDPIGHRLVRDEWWDGLQTSFEIVGVAADVPFLGPGSEPQWAMYYPHQQVPFSDMFLLLKTKGDPLLHAEALRREVWALDPHLPIDGLRTMKEIVAGSLGEPRFQMQLLAAFAGLALLLAAVGIYGVISYSVSQRRGEIGLRLALGARRDQVFSMVLGQGLRLVLYGIAVGLGGAFWAVRVLTSFLFGVEATDPLTFGAVAVVLGGVAVVASYWPARRAMSVDPVESLGYE